MNLKIGTRVMVRGKNPGTIVKGCKYDLRKTYYLVQWLGSEKQDHVLKEWCEPLADWEWDLLESARNEA